MGLPFVDIEALQFERVRTASPSWAATVALESLRRIFVASSLRIRTTSPSWAATVVPKSLRRDPVVRKHVIFKEER